MASLNLSFAAHLTENNAYAEVHDGCSRLCLVSHTGGRTWSPHKVFSLTALYSTEQHCWCTCSCYVPALQIAFVFARSFEGGWRVKDRRRVAAEAADLTCSAQKLDAPSRTGSLLGPVSSRCTAAYRKHFLFKYRRLRCSWTWMFGILNFVIAHPLQCHSFELSRSHNTKDWNRDLNISMFVF